MKVQELIPFPCEKVTFKLPSYKFVPKESGCYVLANYEEEILYIGLSDNLFNRFQQHLKSAEKTSPTKEGKAIWFYFNTYDRSNLPKLERTWLNHFIGTQGRLPILNKVNSPIN